MYLSSLLIDVGSNPDRHRPGRLWLRDINRVHQRLSMGFPSRELKEADPSFLTPFDPSRFERPKFLFRVDSTVADRGPSVVILVQSAIEPDWAYAFQNARMFLAAEPEVRVIDPRYPTGALLRFRVRVNPTRKSKVEQRERPGVDAKGRPRAQGKRVALTWGSDERPDEVIGGWLNGKGERGGFQIQHSELIDLGWVVGYKGKTRIEDTESETADDVPRRMQMKFRSALLDGVLKVTEAEAFRETLITGIGSAKAFGFGLLSVAPVQGG